MEPALRKTWQRRQVGIVSFGRARVDPCDQSVDLPLAESGIIAELRARAGIGRPRRHLALDNLLVQFFMAVHDRVFVPILAAGVVLEGVLIFLFHARVGQVVMDVLVALLALLVLLGIRCYVLLPTLRAESVAEPEPATG